MVPVPLINIGPIGPGAFNTSALNREENYTLNIIRGDRRNGTGQAVTNIADGSATFRKPVDNIGSKSIPQYANYANSHIYDIAIPGCDNGRVFVGQRKDSSSSTSARRSISSTSATRSARRMPRPTTSPTRT